MQNLYLEYIKNSQNLAIKKKRKKNFFKRDTSSKKTQFQE